MRTVVPIARWRPNHKAVSPKAMNITPDKKSLLRNRFNEASPTPARYPDFGAQEPGPSHPNKHDSAVQPKCQVSHPRDQAERGGAGAEFDQTAPQHAAVRTPTSVPPAARQRAQAARRL